MGRILLPLYAILLAGSGIIAIWLKSGIASNPLVSMVLRRLSSIVVVLFVLFALATALIMALLVIQRFYKNLLGTEGYLMFTLPVTTAENIISKGITSTIWILLGGVAGGIGAMVVIVGAGGVPLEEFLTDVREMLNLVFDYAGNGSPVLGGILFAVLMLLGLLQSLAQVYAAAAIGQLWNDHKVLGGILAYIGLSVIEVLVMRIPGIAQLSTTMEEMLEGTGVASMLNLILVTGLGLVIYYVIAWALLDKKLNLE